MSGQPGARECGPPSSGSGSATSASGRGVDRRSLLRLGAAGAALAAVGCAREGSQGGETPPAPMRYRRLGATGLSVSEIAFGAHGVDSAGLMRAALEGGITTFCTSGSYQDGREERALGDALRAAGATREKVVILTGEEVRRGASVARVLDAIDASLRRLGTPYIDVFLWGMVCSPGDLEVPALYEAFDRARTAGKVRHLGLSGHCGGMQPCLEAALAGGRFEVFFIKHDFVSYPDLAGVLARASAQGVGTLVFKTTAGNRQREIRDLEAGGLSFRQATWRWALGSPDVASVAVTMTNFRILREALAAPGAPLSTAEKAMLDRYAREMGSRYCRFCTTCEARCPHGVAVADVMRYAMYFDGYRREKEAMRLYRGLPAGRRAAACASCEGPCDGACPFGREVRSGLVGAHERLRLEEA